MIDIPNFSTAALVDRLLCSCSEDKMNARFIHRLYTELVKRLGADVTRRIIREVKAYTAARKRWIQVLSSSEWGATHGPMDAMYTHAANAKQIAFSAEPETVIRVGY